MDCMKSKRVMLISGLVGEVINEEARAARRLEGVDIPKTQLKVYARMVRERSNLPIEVCADILAQTA